MYDSDLPKDSHYCYSRSRENGLLSDDLDLGPVEYGSYYAVAVVSYSDCNHSSEFPSWLKCLLKSFMDQLMGLISKVFDKHVEVLFNGEIVPDQNNWLRKIARTRLMKSSNISIRQPKFGRHIYFSSYVCPNNMLAERWQRRCLKKLKLFQTIRQPERGLEIWKP